MLPSGYDIQAKRQRRMLRRGNRHHQALPDRPDTAAADDPVRAQALGSDP
jgi:hypothetical protein